MHGRESSERFGETLDIVDRWVRGEAILHENFENYLEETNLAGKPIEAWRKKIKNCKFDCWECQYCDRIEEMKSNVDYTDLVKHVAEAVATSGVPKINNKIPGLTSQRVQTLLNSIAQGVGTYLEIGSYIGATAASVLQNNLITGYFIDLWQEQIQPSRPDIARTPNNNKEKFIENIKPYVKESKITVISSDMLSVNLQDIKEPIQMMFYDGPHDHESVVKVIQYYYPVLAEEAVIVFDDANWEGVVSGATVGLESVNLRTTYKKLILNEEESSQDWWNGLYIVVVKK
jgi:predicted O-methyltransferase YrrM